MCASKVRHKNANRADAQARLLLLLVLAVVVAQVVATVAAKAVFDDVVFCVVAGR